MRCRIIVKYYFQLIKRWVWLGLLGMIFGGLAAAAYTAYSKPVYQAVTRVVVLGQPAAPQTQSVALATDPGRTATLAELITSSPVLAEANARLNMRIIPQRVNATAVRGAQVIEVTAIDGSPNRAAEIANTLVSVFSLHQDQLRSGLYASAEESLQQQINQIKAQMDVIQKSTGQDIQQLREQQLTELQSKIAELTTQISTLQEQKTILENSGPLEPGYDRFNRWGMLPGPLTLEQEQQLAKINNDLEQAKLLLNLYQNVHTDLSYGHAAGRDPRQVGTNGDLSLNQYEQIYSKLLQSYESVRMMKLNLAPAVVQIDPAEPPVKPLSPVPERNIPLGMLGGLLMGLGLAFGLVLIDETFRTPQEVQVLLRLPVLAAVERPERFSLVRRKAGSKTLAVVPAPNGNGRFHRKDIHSLYYHLRVATRWQPIKTVLVAGFEDTDTSAWLAMQLALTAVNAGQHVMLLDANLRNPRLERLMDMKKGPGLGDLLLERNTLGQILQYRQNDCLSLASAGLRIEDVPSHLNPAAVQDLLEDATLLADLVVINSPPFAFAETATLAANVDGVLLAVELNRTRSTHALMVMEQLYLSHASPVGVVIA